MAKSEYKIDILCSKCRSVIIEDVPVSQNLALLVRSCKKCLETAYNRGYLFGRDQMIKAGWRDAEEMKRREEENSVKD